MKKPKNYVYRYSSLFIITLMLISSIISDFDQNSSKETLLEKKNQTDSFENLNSDNNFDENDLPLIPNSAMGDFVVDNAAYCDVLEEIQSQTTESRVDLQNENFTIEIPTGWDIT